MTCPCCGHGRLARCDYNYLNTVIVAPMTRKGRDYPTRVPCRFQGKSGQVVLDQIHTVDKRRLVKRLRILAANTQHPALEVLSEMFAG